jgi:hypothetical protein
LYIALDLSHPVGVSVGAAVAGTSTYDGYVGAMSSFTINNSAISSFILSMLGQNMLH